MGSAVATFDWVAGGAAALLLWICAGFGRAVSRKAVRPGQAGAFLALAILLLCVITGAINLWRLFVPPQAFVAPPPGIAAPVSFGERSAELNARTQPNARTELNARAAELKARVTELRSRTMTAGSALSCLDLVSEQAIEAGCETALFANPQTVASAMAYTEARLSLLTDAAQDVSMSLNKDPGFRWLLRSIEVDRFGFAAYLLEQRACKDIDCQILLALEDPRKIIENLRTRTLERLLAGHAQSWQQEPATAQTSGRTIGGARTLARSTEPFDYPSPSLFPPISIMKPEPGVSSGTTASPSPHRSGSRGQSEAGRPKTAATTSVGSSKATRGQAESNAPIRSARESTGPQDN
jgi:hypothetical protein